MQQLGWTAGPQRTDRLSLFWGRCRHQPQTSGRIGRARARRHRVHWQLFDRTATSATHTVPVVFALVPDPVGSGFVDSLSQPGGNATGFMQFEYGLSGKWLELLKEIAPGLKRAIVLWDPAITAGIGQFAIIQAAATSAGVDVSRSTCATRARSSERSRPLHAPKWRVDRDGERVVYAPSRSDHCASGTA